VREDRRLLAGGLRIVSSTADTSLAACTVRVSSQGTGQDRAGRAVLVTERLAVMIRRAGHPVPEGLTLRHVPVAGLPVDAEILGSAPVTGSDAELVLLAADEPVPGGAPAVLVETGELWGRYVQVLGFPAGYDDGVLSRAVVRAADAAGRVQLDTGAGEYPLGPGFAGAAAWDPLTGGVIGLLAGTGTTLIPSRTLVDVLARLSDDADLAGALRPRIPFPGLTAYDEPDSARFHGRTAATSELLARTHDQRWTCVVGPSGAGKSSLVLAGLVPRVRSSGGTVTVVRGSMAHRLPGEIVDRAIEEAREAGRGGIDLLVLDQVEEVLAAPGGEAALARLCAQDGPSRLRAVLTMRPDTYARLQSDERLARLTRAPFLLAPPDAETVQEILDSTLQHPALHVETGLVARIVADAATVESPLPLLSHAMHELWSRSWARSRAEQAPFTLTSSAYHALGGVTGAINTSAGQVWDALSEAQQEHGRRLLLRLVSKEDRDAPPTRRTEPVEGLSPGQRDVAHRLATAGVLVVGGAPGADPAVVLTHETVVRQWDVLAGLVRDHAALLIWRTGLDRDAERWDAHGRDPDQAPGGDTVDEADDPLATFPGTDESDFLDGVTREYLAAGRLRRRRRRRSRALAITGVAAVSAVAVVLAASVVSGWAAAREAQRVADSHSLVRESQHLEAVDPGLSVMTALAAYETAATRESRNQLLRTYMTYSEDDRILDRTGELESFEVSEVSEVSEDGEVVLRSSNHSVGVTTGALSGPRERYEFVSDEKIETAHLARAGNRVVVFYERGGGAWFDIDGAAGRGLGEPHELADAGIRELPPADQEPFNDTTWEEIHGWHASVDPEISHDGRFVAARVWDHLVVWSLTTGSVLHRAPVAPLTESIWFGREADTVVTAVTEERGGDIDDLVVVGMVSGRTRDLASDVSAVTVVAGGGTAITCSEDGEKHVVIQRIDTADGSLTAEPLRQGAEFCAAPLVDGAGELLYAGSTLTDLDTGKTLSSPDVDVSGDLIIENDGTLYGTGRTNDALVYREIPRSGEDGAAVVSTELAADGSRLFAVRQDGVLESRSLDPDDATDPPLATVPRPKPLWEFEGADSLQENRSGSLLLERTGRNTLVVRDAETLAVRATIRAAEPPPLDHQVVEPATTAFTYHFSGDDVVTVSGSAVQLWGGTTGAELAALDLTEFEPARPDQDPDEEQAATVSAGPGPRPGTVQVTVQDEPGVLVVDIRSGRVLETLALPQDTTAVQFDRSGTYLAVLRSGSILELWERDPLERRIGPLPSLTEDTTVPFFAGFTRDRGVYAVGTGNQLTLYDIEQRAAVDSYSLAATGGRGAFVDVSANLSHMIYLSPELTGTVVPLDQAQWQDHLCTALAGRDFTEDETAALPGDVRSGLICQE
jgi:energy-coupling factor transporter ATP-binding protein EcfA2